MNAPERVLARVRRYIEALPPKQQAAAKKQLADAIGLGEGTIRGWLNGSSRAMPRLEYLDALACGWKEYRQRRRFCLGSAERRTGRTRAALPVPSATSTTPSA